jgi:hypothetical protein
MLYVVGGTVMCLQGTTITNATVVSFAGRCGPRSGLGGATEPHARCEAVTASGRHGRHCTYWRTHTAVNSTIRSIVALPAVLLMPTVRIMHASVGGYNRNTASICYFKQYAS